MDWIEIPARTLGWIDLQLATAFDPTLRLIVWSIAAGALTMLLYGLLSPQRHIAAAKAELVQARQRLDRFDGDFADAMPLMRNMLASAFRQLGLVVGPALAAVLPMVVLAAWIAQTYGHDFPASEQQIAVRAAPESMQAQWLPSQTRADGAVQPPRVLLRDDAGRALGEVEMQAPVAVIGKRTFWAAMAGNPLGFLPDDLPIDRIELDLPRREFLGWGPGWMRSWEFLFFSVLTIVALGLKRALHLQ